MREILAQRSGHQRQDHVLDLYAVHLLDRLHPIQWHAGTSDSAVRRDRGVETRCGSVEIARWLVGDAPRGQLLAQSLLDEPRDAVRRLDPHIDEATQCP